MKNTQQTEGQSIYDHCQSVKCYTFDLLDFILHDEPLKYEWRLPQWVVDNKAKIGEALLSTNDIHMYTIMHDCGKPYCREVDENGKIHFPQHEGKSAEVFGYLYPEWKVAKQLIASDMDIHVLKGCDVEEFAKRPEAVTLLIVGLAEIHSNAQMFGGMDSISFKIKWKHINQRGKAIIPKV